MSRVEHIGNATLYLGDCREILPTLAGVDAIVTDPPYGIKHSGSSKRFSGGNTARGHNGRGGAHHGQIKGDDAPFDPSHLLQAGRVQVIFGCNNFMQHLGPGSLLVWAKRRPHAYGTFLADGEVAWLSKGRGIYMMEKTFAGSSAAMEAGFEPHASSAHPFQKPISVMEWCIGFCADAQVICDPYMGSGTTGIAAASQGRRFVGIEVEAKYFDIACWRLDAAHRQSTLAV